MTKKITVQIEDYTLECSYSPGRPAQLYGPPENCYPAEAAEIEILSAKLEGKPPMTVAGQDYLLNEYFDQIVEAIEEQLRDEYEAHQEYLGEARRELREEQS